MKTALNVALAGTAMISMLAFSIAASAEETVTVVAAKSAVEHQKVVEALTQKAVALESEAAWHDVMPRFYGVSFPKATAGNSSAHCRALRDQLNAEAKAVRAEALKEYKLAASEN